MLMLDIDSYGGSTTRKDPDRPYGRAADDVVVDGTETTTAALCYVANATSHLAQFVRAVVTDVRRGRTGPA